MKKNNEDLNISDNTNSTSDVNNIKKPKYKGKRRRVYRRYKRRRYNPPNKDDNEVVINDEAIKHNDTNATNIISASNMTNVSNMTNETNVEKPKYKRRRRVRYTRFIRRRRKKNVDELFSNFIKDIELKNEEFENNILTTKTVEEEIKKIKDKKKIELSKSEIESETYKKSFNGEDIIKYTKECQKNPLTEKNVQNFKFSENPKISIIVPFYNSINYLNILHKSIQDQSMQDIEIIYIDDCSTDKSDEFIQNLQKKDKRIILLKNKERKGSFYSRNKGAIFARGEYLQYVDSADLLVGNILEKAYINAKTNNVDIIQFKAIKEDKKKFQIFDELEKRSIIKQPDLSKEKLYDFSDLKIANNYIFNKLIKKEKYLESLKYLEDEVLKENLCLEEDYIQFISLLKVSESFLFIDHIGYAIIRNRDFKSLMDEFDKNKMANKMLHDKFIELKFIFKKTKDNEFDKELFSSYFSRIKSLYSPIAKQVTEGYELFGEVFDLVLKGKLLDKKTKEEFSAFRDDIMINRKKDKKINLN